MNWKLVLVSVMLFGLSLQTLAEKPKVRESDVPSIPTSKSTTAIKNENVKAPSMVLRESDGTTSTDGWLFCRRPYYYNNCGYNYGCGYNSCYYPRFYNNCGYNSCGYNGWYGGCGTSCGYPQTNIFVTQPYIQPYYSMPYASNYTSSISGGFVSPYGSSQYSSYVNRNFVNPGFYPGAGFNGYNGIYNNGYNDPYNGTIYP